jgi:hypothetical protein
MSDFWAKVNKTDGCWEWTRGKSWGYGVHTSGGKRHKAHRFAYELLVGPIPGGLTLDHLCRNRGCVNPTHLEPVTNRENILRGSSPAATRARQTECKNGHPFDEANTYRDPRGYRECRICKVAYNRRWRAVA